jgi:hypothetical protein
MRLNRLGDPTHGPIHDHLRHRRPSDCKDGAPRESGALRWLSQLRHVSFVLTFNRVSESGPSGLPAGGWSACRSSLRWHRQSVPAGSAPCRVGLCHGDIAPKGARMGSPRGRRRPAQGALLRPPRRPFPTYAAVCLPVFRSNVATLTRTPALGRAFRLSVGAGGPSGGCVGATLGALAAYRDRFPISCESAPMTGGVVGD